MANRIIQNLNLKKVWNVELMEDAREILEESSCIAVEGNRIIALRVRTHAPDLSAKIADAYVDNLKYFNRELNIGIKSDVIRVIDTASVPERNVPRGVLEYTLLSAVISFLFGIFLAFLLDFITTNNMGSRIREYQKKTKASAVRNKK